MGDPYILGGELNKVHKPKPEWSILVLTSIFTLIGILLIYAMSLQGLEVEWRIKGMLKRSTMMFISGTVIIIALYFFDYRKFKPFSKYLYIGTSILTILGGRFISIPVLGIVSTDTTYITPILYAIALSGIFSGDRWDKNKTILNLIILFLPVILILRFQSAIAYSIILYFTMVLVLILVSGGDFKYILGSIGIGVAMVTFSIINASYRVERLKNALNPLRDPQGSSYMNVQLRKLITSAGFLGKGTNIDKNKIGILSMPEIRTDYVFSYIVHVFGWLAGIAVIVLTIIFFIRLIKITKDIEDNYGRLLVATFSSLFIVQFAYNILMILGLAPLAGISMPFISYGTLLNLINMIMIGIISSVYRRKDIKEINI